MLLLDEPVNGLDPDGVAWIRGLLRSLAAEGRTVLVSSHLMSEMENTAGHLIVIGRGRLIADTSLEEFTRRASGGWVEVSSPQARRLARLLGEHGAAAGACPDGTSLAVRGLSAAAVGDLATRHQIALHQLVTRQPSLEEAFMGLTGDAAGYRPRQARQQERSHDAGDGPGPRRGPQAARAVARRHRARGVDQAAHAAVHVLDTAGHRSRDDRVRGALCAAYARHLTPASRAALDPAAYSQSGFFLAQLAIGVLGVLTVTGEYATGSIRSTLTAVPQRVTVLAAKAAVFAAVAFLTGLTASLAAFFLGQAIFAGQGIREHLTYCSPGQPRDRGGAPGAGPTSGTSQLST